MKRERERKWYYVYGNLTEQFKQKYNYNIEKEKMKDHAKNNHSEGNAQSETADSFIGGCIFQLGSGNDQKDNKSDQSGCKQPVHFVQQSCFLLVAVVCHLHDSFFQFFIHIIYLPFLI